MLAIVCVSVLLAGTAKLEKCQYCAIIPINAHLSMRNFVCEPVTLIITRFSKLFFTRERVLFHNTPAIQPS